MLAICYYWGNGVSIDLDKAFKLFQVLAEKGQEDAEYYLSTMYYEGEGTEKNLEKAFEYTKKFIFKSI